MATRTITEGVTIARRRRLSETYIGEWLMTTDHKKIGIMYVVTGFFFFLVGGMEALLIRTQLAFPDGTVLTPEEYNSVFTMHGVTRPMTLHVKLATPASGDSLPAHTRWIVTTDPINRKDFGLTFGDATESISGISNNITPIIEIEAVQK